MIGLVDAARAGHAAFLGRCQKALVPWERMRPLGRAACFLAAAIVPEAPASDNLGQTAWDAFNDADYPTAYRNLPEGLDGLRPRGSGGGAVIVGVRTHLLHAVLLRAGPD